MIWQKYFASVNGVEKDLIEEKSKNLKLSNVFAFSLTVWALLSKQMLTT